MQGVLAWRQRRLVGASQQKSSESDVEARRGCRDGRPSSSAQGQRQGQRDGRRRRVAASAVFRPATAMVRRLEAELGREEMAEYQLVFRMFDTDGSGSIARDELATAMESLGLSASQKEVDELINEYDVDGNGEIDFEVRSVLCAVCLLYIRTDFYIAGILSLYEENQHEESDVGGNNTAMLRCFRLRMRTNNCQPNARMSFVILDGKRRNSTIRVPFHPQNYGNIEDDKIIEEVFR